MKEEVNFDEKQLFITNEMKLKPHILKPEIKAVRLIYHKRLQWILYHW